jgi:citrate lyase subunit beta/citryl-CoA lyase
MDRLRRACLVVPATSWSKLEKASGIDVDEVVIDLEDAVPAAHKTDDTRRQAADAIAQLSWRAPTVAVRVNAVGTPWFEEDVAAVVGRAGDRLGAIVLPKVESADAVAEAISAIDAARPATAAATPIALEALIESALGVLRVDSIAEASPRLDALIFGGADYAASMGLSMAGMGAIDPDYPGDQWAYPRARIAVAARAFGLDAIDGPFGAFRDRDGLAESARRARAVGFSGKWAIHPDQVEICMTVFGPTEGEVTAAEQTLADLEAAGRTGSRATVSDGSMVDEASRRQAERTLERARRAAP